MLPGIVTTVAHGVASIPSSASTNPPRGVPCVLRFSVPTRCVGCARRVACWSRPGSWTTSRQSRTAAPSMTKAICNASVLPATTPRRHERQRAAGLQPPRGLQSLQLHMLDACACTDFCACTMKNFFVQIGRENTLFSVPYAISEILKIAVGKNVFSAPFLLQTPAPARLATIFETTADASLYAGRRRVLLRKSAAFPNRHRSLSDSGSSARSGIESPCRGRVAQAPARQRMPRSRLACSGSGTGESC